MIQRITGRSVESTFVIDEPARQQLNEIEGRLERLVKTHLGEGTIINARHPKQLNDGVISIAATGGFHKARGSDLFMQVGFDKDEKPIVRFLINHREHSLEHMLDEAGSMEKLVEFIDASIEAAESQLVSLAEHFATPPPPSEEVAKTLGDVGQPEPEEAPDPRLALIQSSAGKGVWAGAKIGWQVSEGLPLWRRTLSMLVLAGNGMRVGSLASQLRSGFARSMEEYDFEEAVYAKADRGEPLTRKERKRLEGLESEQAERLGKHAEAFRVREFRWGLKQLTKMRKALGRPMPEGEVHQMMAGQVERFITMTEQEVGRIMAERDLDTVTEGMHLISDMSRWIKTLREEGVELSARALQTAARASSYSFQIDLINRDRMKRDDPDREAELERYRTPKFELEQTHPLRLNAALAEVSEDVLSPRAKQSVRETAWYHAMERSYHQLYDLLEEGNPFRAQEAAEHVDSLRQLLKWKDENGLDPSDSIMARLQRAIDGLEKYAGQVRRLDAERTKLEAQL